MKLKMKAVVGRTAHSAMLMSLRNIKPLKMMSMLEELT